MLGVGLGLGGPALLGVGLGLVLGVGGLVGRGDHVSSLAGESPGLEDFMICSESQSWS